MNYLKKTYLLKDKEDFNRVSTLLVQNGHHLSPLGRFHYWEHSPEHNFVQYNIEVNRWEISFLRPGQAIVDTIDELLITANREND